MVSTPDDDLVLERREPLRDTMLSDGSAYRKVAKKNPARSIWRWITIIMGVIVGYNVLNAIGLQDAETRADLCAGLSEFGCDLTIGAATAVNVTFAIGAGLIGLVALIVWRTRDIYKEVVEPIPPGYVQPATQPPEPPPRTSEPTTQPMSKIDPPEPTPNLTDVEIDTPRPFGFLAKDGHVLIGDGCTYWLASRWARLAGAGIDLVIVFIAIEIAITLIGVAPNSGTDYVVSWLIGVTYWTVGHSTAGRTIGKLICGTKVLVADTGLTPSLGTAAMRALVLSLLAPLVALPVLWKESRRGWHDDAANTVVVATRRRYG